jgi:hypothetical protein
LALVNWQRAPALRKWTMSFHSLPWPSVVLAVVTWQTVWSGRHMKDSGQAQRRRADISPSRRRIWRRPTPGPAGNAM